MLVTIAISTPVPTVPGLTRFDSPQCHSPSLPKFLRSCYSSFIFPTLVDSSVPDPSTPRRPGYPALFCEPWHGTPSLPLRSPPALRHLTSILRATMTPFSLLLRNGSMHNLVVRRYYVYLHPPFYPRQYTRTAVIYPLPFFTAPALSLSFPWFMPSVDRLRPKVSLPRQCRS